MPVKAQSELGLHCVEKRRLRVYGDESYQCIYKYLVGGGGLEDESRLLILVSSERTMWEAPSEAQVYLWGWAGTGWGPVESLPWRYSADIWKGSCLTGPRCPCLSLGLEQVPSRGPFQPQQFCDYVDLKTSEMVKFQGWICGHKF